ncbi:MAG: diguanylate cyclase [Rubrivivax sp.]|nr:diguanylate cyclase [Rubrivivax sp.]
MPASEQFLRSVMDGLSARIGVLDEAGRIVMVNRAWREFVQCRRECACGGHEGTNWLETRGDPAGGATDAPLFASLLRDLLAGRCPQFEFECACHAATEQRWFVVRVARIAGSQPPCFVVSHHDVTSLKQVQETLRRSEGLLLDLAASIPGVMFRMVRRSGGELAYSYMSPGVQALFGISPAQACADRGALLERVLPEDRAALEAGVSEACARGGAWELEFRTRTADGQIRWYQTKARPTPSEDGEMEWTGVSTDITERKAIELALQASEQTYRTLFETVPQGVVYQDVQGRITAANPAAQRILGLTLEQMQDPASIDPLWRAVREDGSDLPADEIPTRVALRTGQPVHDVVMGVAMPERGRVWIHVSATPLFSQGGIESVYTTFEDITRSVRLSQELKQQAATDDLTGLANRRSLMEHLNGEVQRIARHPELQCSVLALDIDHFKDVNDRWGHAAGDALLVHLAQLMRETVRQVDVVGRTGGEEFTLLLPDTRPEEARALAERLRERVGSSPLHHEGKVIAITVSIGVSAVVPSDARADAVLVRADRALYRAKNAGRNAVRLS